MPAPNPVPNAAPAPAPFTLRAARRDDMPAVVGLISELAHFEHLSHLLQITPEALAAELFREGSVVECTVAEAEGAGTGPALVAFALFFTTFSTFLGRRGLWLEDLYVQPDWRGRGVGVALLRHGARLAVARGCGRYEWCVLDWNERAVNFYQGLGASLMPDWRLCRITGSELLALGAPEPAPA